jgi:hypothetical protein
MTDTIWSTELFKHRKLNAEGHQRVYEYIILAETMLELIHENKPSRDLSLALTKLEESVMWFTKGISDIKEFQE